MKKAIILCLLASLCLCSVSTNLRKFKLGALPWDFKNCGSENDPMVITGVTMDAVPEKGVNDNINIVIPSFISAKILNQYLKINRLVLVMSMTELFKQELMYF